ncbi:MAG: hypothetical protein M3Q16_12570 [Pseudomonadota bacterium]|nr:hypothetical protein [Pseudomonadota bacterium]
MDKGVRITAIGPTYVETTGRVRCCRDSCEMAVVHLMGSLASEVAEMGTFLLPERASFVTRGFHLMDAATHCTSRDIEEPSVCWLNQRH